MQQRRRVRRALLSVSDKAGILEFARSLSQRNIELLSTGGTARLLNDAGLTVTEVSEYTGFPEMMDGQVKTLHPKIHGGILGRRGQDEAVMAAHQIAPIDMVVINLYPFSQTIESANCTLEKAIENIDIGGPAMVRSAAKNHMNVAIIVRSTDYNAIIAEMDNNENSLLLTTRFELALQAFTHTATYDRMIADYFASLLPDRQNQMPENSHNFPETFNLNFVKKQDLRYGENSHQKAAFYVEKPVVQASVSGAQQLQGKALSYNNIADTDAALECVKQFDEPACVIVKHANPCGVATGETILEAYDRAWKTDSTSAFGGIIAFNRELDDATAEVIINRQFVEVIIAPSLSAGAQEIISDKQNVRVLTLGQWQQSSAGLDFKRVNGGLLVQEHDLSTIDIGNLRIVSKRQPNDRELRDALFSWKVAKFVKSNAIVYARENMTIGIGAGQMSRVYSAKIAGIKAEDEGLKINGAVMASDAFLPFRDGIDAAHAVGVSCVIQPGGSIRDDEVIAAADEHDIAMIFTNVRHFRH